MFAIQDLVGMRGITIGPVLGLPSGPQGKAEPRTIAPAELTGPLRIVDERATRFGLMYGARLGDPVMRRGSPPDLPHWLVAPRDHRTVSIDWRRLPDVHTDPGVTFMAYLRRYLEAVASSASGLPAGFGQLTAEDRVVILCDDQKRGGLLLAVFTLKLPEGLVVSATIGSDEGFDNVRANATEPRRFDRTLSYAPIYSATASTVVHELGHTYRLAAEYESSRGPVAIGPGTIGELEPYENVQAIEELEDPAPAIRTSWIKWNLPRVVAAARVTAIVVTGLRVALAIADAAKLPWLTVSKKLFLRPTLYTPRAAPKTPRLELFEVEVVSVSASTVIVQSVFAVPEPSFVRGGVLYDPLLSVGGVVKLIDGTVALHIAANGAFPKPAVRTPGPQPGPCYDQHERATWEAVDAPPIPNGPTTRDRWKIVGLHNGGYFASCGVARPAGRCKLRRAYDFTGTGTGAVWQFCHVCKYVIVDLVDPGKHAALDRDYP